MCSDIIFTEKNLRVLGDFISYYESVGRDKDTFLSLSVFYETYLSVQFHHVVFTDTLCHIRMGDKTHFLIQNLKYFELNAKCQQTIKLYMYVIHIFEIC